MAHVGAPTAQANPPAGPRTPLQQHERQEQKRDLASWWKNFKRSDKKPQEAPVPQGIFGVPLQQSIRYANVAISLINDEGYSYIYGYVPIVVAKCGVFLKERATETEGIFRVAGNEKRIKELKAAFDSPDRFGKGLDWNGYTVHDAANVLRRYFNLLPEPIIPLDFYNRFRDPLRNHQAQAVGQIEAQSPSVGHFDPDAAIQEYQQLITELPPLNRQLLLYILDLLAVFASKSDLNKMTTPNLAAIFQPGILIHPSHDMAPSEYRLSQDVLIFLIENQDSFLIGMQGTEADPQTVKDVQSGTPTKTPGTPLTPTRSKTIVGRSSSNSSTRAESVRKVSEVRRNGSVSSKQSKRSDNGPTPVLPGMSPSGSIHRSNTVPSRRDGSNAHTPRITREKGSGPSTPNSESPGIVVDTSKARQESLQSTPVAGTPPRFPAAPEVASTSSGEASVIVGSEASSATARDYTTPKRDTTPLIAQQGTTEKSTAQTPSTTPGRFLGIFNPSPPGGDEGRKPNKLQKRRIPGTSISSAQSSSNSLGLDEHSDTAQRSPISPTLPNSETRAPQGEQSAILPIAVSTTQSRQSSAEHPISHPQTTEATLAPPGRNFSADSGGHRPGISPAHSYRSGTESDAEMVGDDMPKDATPMTDKERKRHRWRFSRTQNKLDSGPAVALSSPNPLGTLTSMEQTTSKSTIGSGGDGKPRRSFQDPYSVPSSSTADPVTIAGGAGLAQGGTFSSSSTEPVFSDSEREKKGGLGSWIRGKMGAGKEKEREQREREVQQQQQQQREWARTPEPSLREYQRDSRPDLRLAPEAIPVRGKSIEVPRAAEVPMSAPPALVGGQTTSPVSSVVQAAPASAPGLAGDRDAAPPLQTLQNVRLPASSERGGSESTAEGARVVE